MDSSDFLDMSSNQILIIEIEHLETFPEGTLNAMKFPNVKKVFLRELHSGFSIQEYAVVIFHCESLNERHLGWLLPFAQRCKNSQFLILSKKISIHAYRNVSMMKNLIAVQIPCSDELLLRLVQQIGNEISVPEQNKFPRFITDEPVRMVVMETGLLIPTRMKNYSTSGAYLEYKGISLRVGHNLKVNLINQENPPSKKSLQLNARVVWVKEENRRSGRTSGIGIQFIEL